jgi:hypothetical protein
VKGITSRAYKVLDPFNQAVAFGTKLARWLELMLCGVKVKLNRLASTVLI